MPTTVVGLYRTEADVQRVADDLSSHGFSTGEINRHDEASSGLRSWLIDQGVPEHDAEDYILGVRNGGKLVTLEASDDRADEAVSIMQRHEEAGGMRTDHAATRTGTPADTTDRARTTTSEKSTKAGKKGKKAASASDQHETLEVVEEELEVGTREVEGGGVRVRTYVTERPVEKNVSIHEEKVSVDRQPADRPLRGAEADQAFEERSVEMSERSEEVVVGKRARVVEEVSLSKDVQDRTETVRDTVRRTDVDVERTDDIIKRDQDHYRRHHRDTLGRSEHEYGEHEPAYRFGIDLANHPDYRDRDWNEIAPTAREHWERQNAGTWSEFEPAIRYGYERSAGGGR